MGLLNYKNSTNNNKSRLLSFLVLNCIDFRVGDRYHKYIRTSNTTLSQFEFI